MSLAGRFLPSTMRMESALRRAMAGGQRSRDAEPRLEPALPRPRAHVRAGGAAGCQSAHGGGERGGAGSHSPAAIG